MTTPKRSTTVASLLLGPAAVAAISLTAMHLSGTGTLGTTTTAVAKVATALDPALTAKDVFVRAVTLLQTVGVPPNASVDRVPTADDIQQMEDNGKFALGRLFASSAIGEGTARLNNAAQIARTEVRALGGGVSNVTYDAVAANADGSFSISAHVTAWARLAQVIHGQAAVATPSNVLIVKATLVPSGTTYLVSFYSWEFAPGSQP